MAILEYNAITPKKVVVLDGEPYEVLASHVFRKQQRKPVNQTKLKNLITGKVTERAFHQSEKAEEAAVEKRAVTFLYRNRGEYWFCEAGNPRARFTLSEDAVGPGGVFLKENSEVAMISFGEKTLGVAVPVKVELRVTESPPAVRGNTAQGATKEVVLETGARIQAPLFIAEGDLVRVNTETGQYVERATETKK